MAQLNYKELGENEILLLIAPSDKIQEVILGVLKYYVDEDAYCTYVSVSKPAKTVQNILAKNKIKTDKIFFVDCITSSTIGEDMERAENIVFCNPKSLTNISLILTTALNSLPKDVMKVLVLDTFSTLLLYNEAMIVNRFMHSLTSKLREWNVKSVIFTLEEETDKKIIAQLTQFCDKAVKVN